MVPNLAIDWFDPVTGKGQLYASWDYDGKNDPNILTLLTTPPGGAEVGYNVETSQSGVWAAEEAYIPIDVSCDLQGTWSYRVQLNHCYTILSPHSHDSPTPFR